MFKQIIKIIFIIWFITIISTSFALSSKQKGVILEKFKELEYEMIFESDEALLDSEDKSALNLSRKINIFGDIKDDLSEKRKYAQVVNLQNLNKMATLKETISILDEDIEEKTKEIAKINTQVIEIKNEIWSNEQIIKTLRDRVEESRAVLLEYLVYIYKKWNYIYDDDSIDNLKAIIFSWEDIWEAINDLYFKWIIEVTGKKLIDNHRNYIKKLYLEKISLEKKEVKLKQLRKNDIIERKTLKDKKEYKERILEQTKWREALFKKYIEDKLAMEKQIKIKQLKEKIKFKNIQNKLLDKYNCEFVDITRSDYDLSGLSERCLNLNKMIYSESKLKWFDEEWVNIFSWPVYPEFWISSFYQDKEYRELFRSDHEAIDIIARQWTPIKAPADWYVVYVLPPDTNDYAYIALKHSNWYVTVYGHVSEVLVWELDFVEAWDIFAKTGGEYGTKWAWLITTGPHLHFEVFLDKKTVDPLNFLDLSVFAFNSLPEKYKFKFYADFRTKKWYEYKDLEEKTKSFRLEWATESERQKNLINKYATSSFRNWSMWVEESLDWNIDPTFVMCIWLAETGLGRNLKTPYNVWNIWNTDSWATKDYMNARSWIYWIVRTLNNRILWHYNEIKDLSRYGNKTWPIYASSPDHWHNNIIKCMSAIKWMYVPDSYNFRIIR